MKLRVKITWIVFYIFALVILILNGHMKPKHLHNFWKEFLNIVKKSPRSDEDSDWTLVHKNDKK